MFRADAELRLFLLRRAFSKIRVEALAMVWGSLLGRNLPIAISVALLLGVFRHAPNITGTSTVVQLSRVAHSRNGEGAASDE